MSQELEVGLRIRAFLDEARKAVQGLDSDLQNLGKTGNKTSSTLNTVGTQAAGALNGKAAPGAALPPAPPPPVPAPLPAPTPIAPKTDEGTAALRRLMAALQSAAPAAEKLAAAQSTLNAALATGSLTQERYASLMAAATARWGAHNDAVHRGGVTAGQTAAAMRMLPAQITDITTSLASGMPIWLVAIQQGGQIKDSFGGIGPALKQIGSLFTVARVAAGAAAAAFAAVALAAYKGAQEAPAYNEALIMSGNAAGTTAGKLGDMAARISDVVGTQAAAAATLTQIAGSGRVAAQDIERFTLAAQQMERAGGQAAEKTAATFVELGKAPLQASLKLTESLNYLTPATRDHIKTLEEQGRTAEAAAAAQQAYFEMLNARTPQLEANLGTLQRMWRGVGEAAGWAWDKMLSIGRQATLDAQIEAQQKTVERLAQNLATRQGRGMATGDVEGPLSAAREHLRNLQEDKDEQASLARTQGEVAKVRREYNEAEKANDRWADKALSKNEQINKELTKYRENNKKINAGRISDGMAPLDAKTVAAQEAAIRKEIMSKGGGGAPSAFRTASAEVAVTKAELQANFTALQTNIRAGDAIIVQALQDGNVSIGDAYQARLAQMRTESAAQREVLEADLREIDAALAKAKNSAESGPLRQRRVEVAAQINLVDANLSEQSRKLGVWKTEQERTLGTITAKIRVDVANLTGTFDRDAVQAQLKSQFQGDYEAAGRAASEGEQAAGRARIDMLVAAGTAQAEFNAKLAEAQRLQNALGVQEQAVQVLQQTGAISAIEAESRIASARERQAPALQAIVVQLQAMRDAMPADAAAAIDAMNVSIGQLQNTARAATPDIVSFGTQARSTAIDGLANAAGQAVTNFKNMREVLKNTLKQIAGDILSSGIKKVLTNQFKPDASTGGGNTSGSSNSSLFGAIGTLFGSLFGFRDGGHIKGPGTGTSDSIPALVDGRRPIAVSNNEFIQPDKAVRHYGVGFMEAIRTLRFPKPGFAFGGLVQAHQRARFATGGSVAGAAAAPPVGPVPLSLTLNNNGTPQRVADNSATWDGKQMLVNLMLEDAQTGGPITRGMQQAMNRGS